MGDATGDEIRLSRRKVMAAVAGAGAAGAAMLNASAAEAQKKVAAPVKALAGEVKPLYIKSVESFDVVVPQPKGTAEGRNGQTPGRINVTRVTTDSGVRGYSFMGTTADMLKAAQALVGKDLFELENHLKAGLGNWGAVDEAIWDAIGRVAGQPVHRLMGGTYRETLPVYITYTWPGGAEAPSFTPRVQGDWAKNVKDAGFKRMKIQCFRKNSDLDAEACALILQSGGPDFKVMVDRTAGNSGSVWTYQQGVYAAKALEKAGCHWLEEPFARDDYDGPARLQGEVSMLITGGEGYKGLAPYRECVLHNTYQILQPECRQIAGITLMRKVGVLAETWGLKMAPHGSSGLAWAGRVQCSAAMGSYMQEISVLQPPNFPDDICKPFLALLHGEQPFRYRNGDVIVPQGPGLGLNVDDAALNKYRVEGIQAAGPGGGRGAPPPGAAGAPGGRGAGPGAAAPAAPPAPR